MMMTTRILDLIENMTEPGELDIRVSEGRNGRWRWAIYHGGRFIASGHPRGWESEAEARSDVQRTARIISGLNNEDDIS